MTRTGLIFLLFATGACAARQPVAAEDWWNWRAAGDPRISPDGHMVVYTESWNDRTANARFANLRLVSSDGREMRALTEGPWCDRMPRWSPESDRVAWISQRGGKPEIHVRTLDSSTGEIVIPTAEAPLSLVLVGRR